MGLGLGSAACGGASPPPADPAEPAAGDAAPDAAAGQEADSDPESEFDRAEAELNGLWTQDDGEPLDGPRPMQEDGAAMSAGRRCTIACKALASMKRSANRICDMTGEGDSRCESLRERVERARSRVFSSCPSCEAARP